MKNKYIKNNSGYVMLLTTIIFMMVSTVIIFGLSTPTLQQIFSSRDIWSAKQSYYLSEAGVEDVVYRLKDSTMSANVGTTETLSFGGYSEVTQISNTVTGKTVSSLSNQNGYKKNIETKLTQCSDVSFNYGIFAGSGGFTITGGSEVTGNVYSNGDIVASSGVKITGSAIAASGSKILGNGGDYLYIGSTSTDMAWAKDVSNVSLIGNLYCSTGIHNAGEKTCNTSRDIPSSMSMSVSDNDINQWKLEALAGGTYNGNYTSGWDGGILGPRKINGNLEITSGTLMITGTIWVTGNITFSNGGGVKLSSSLGGNSAIILADGYVNIIGGAKLLGSGTAGSYPIVVSTSICPNTTPCANNNAAINISNGSESGVLIAPYGEIYISGGNKDQVAAHSVSGNSIYLSSAYVTYEAGVASPSFSSGPYGGWVISGWKELEN